MQPVRSVLRVAHMNSQRDAAALLALVMRPPLRRLRLLLWLQRTLMDEAERPEHVRLDDLERLGAQLGLKVVPEVVQISQGGRTKWETASGFANAPPRAGAVLRSELDRLASPDRADQYLAPAPIRAPGLCHPTCPNRAN